MNTVQRFLGQAVACQACGREHRVGVREALLSDDACERLPAVTAALGLPRGAVVIADTRTRAAAGAAVAEAFRRRDGSVTEIVLPDPPGGGGPVCDDHTRRTLDRAVPAEGLLVAVGSGVVNDLVKWMAVDTGRPYVVVPTAASMNGYTSANIAPTLKGVKSLLEGREPVAVVTSTAILRSAPAALTAAGLGDVMAKPVSSADWRLNHLVFDEFYCPFCADLIREIEPIYVQAPEAIALGRPEGLEALYEAILLTGFSMTMAGTSSPASGGEHLISHTLDMMASRDGLHHDLHGRQVGLGTLFCAALYQEVFRTHPGRFRSGQTRTEPMFWKGFADAVEDQHVRKRRRQTQAAERLNRESGLWDRLAREAGGLCCPPETVRRVLRQGGAACRLQDIGVSRERFIEAVDHAHELRERYTILELARSAGVLPERTPELVDTWLCG